MRRTDPFEMRPRLLWRVVVVLLAGAFSFGALTEGDWILAIFALLSWGSAAYLMTARVLVDGDEVSVERLGRRYKAARLDRLERWDTYFSGPIPSQTLSAEDSEGGRLVLERTWWGRWAELRDRVASTGARRTDIREELGRYPLVKGALAAILIGIFMFVLVLGRSWGDTSTEVLVVDAAMWGILGALGSGAYLALAYWDANNDSSGDD